MICAYCKKDKSSTREHIISDSVLELFPECDLTVDSARNKQYKADPVVKDVCADCNNNRLTYIDKYAKNLISKYFLKEYTPNDKLEFDYEYDKLLKVLLKYTFNALRSHNDDISFFDSEVLDFLLNEQNKDFSKHVTLLGGLWVNTSAMPEFIFGNLKLRWVKDPVFLDNSIIRYYDEWTGQVYYREDNKPMELKGLKLSYLYRFYTGLFVILIWESEEAKIRNEKFLPLSYPYKVIKPAKGSEELERCTHAYNCHNPFLIDVTWGIPMADATNSMVRTDINPLDIQRNWNEEWKEYEEEVRKKQIKR